MKNFFVTALIVPFLLISCSQKQAPLLTTDLSRTDYTDMIRANGTVQSVNTVNVMAPTGFFMDMLVDWAIPEGTRVEKGDKICILTCPALNKELDDQLDRLKGLNAEFKKLEANTALSHAMLDAQLKENAASMTINQLDSVQIRYAPQAQQKMMALNLEISRIQEKKLKKKVDASVKIDETEIRQLKSRILQAENDVKRMQEQVDGLIIVAPKAGIISKSLSNVRMMISFGPSGDAIEISGYPKKGGHIFPEMAMMAIPDLTEMQVSVKVLEADYKRIEKGQPVEITVDAAAGLRTTGSVKRKSMVGQGDYYSDSQVKWYEIIVGVDSLHSRMPLAFTARCDIFVNRIRDTVVVPTLAIFERDSMKVVYVSEGDMFRPVPVETSLTNSSQTIVTHGLKGTETIALIEPPTKSIEKPNKKTNE